MESSASARTIDDFLEQLYREYRRGPLPHTSGGDAGTKARTRRPLFHNPCLGQSACGYYFPLPLLALCVANSSDATEILMLSYLLANSAFRRDMFSDSSNGDDADSSSSMEGAEYLAASIFLGMLLGGTLFGFLSDHIGRRPALLAGLAINAIAGLSSSFPFLTPTFVQLTAWRFTAGIGIGATVPSIFSLASEWSPKEVRGAVVTLVASFWMVGSLFVSGLAWLLFGGNLEHEAKDHDTFPMWRIFAALCAMPSALGAWMVYCHVPESPRFLASANRNYGEAARVCNSMATSLGVKLMDNAKDSASFDGTKNQPEAENSLQETSESIAISNTLPLTEDELRHDISSSICADGTGTILPMTTRLRHALHTLFETLQSLYSPQLMTRTTLPLQIIWFSLSFGTYGITTWINTLFVEIHLQNIYFNSFLFALANLPGNILSVLYSDKWGRKRMLVGSLLGAAGGLAGFAILVYCGNVGNDNANDDSTSQSQSNARARGIVLSACLFQMFSIVSWSTIDVLTGEMFPTRVRSAGIGLCTAAGRFGAMFAQFVNARLIRAGDGEAGASSSVLIVAASTLLIGAGIPLFLERDMTLGELKDDITVESSNKSYTLGCIGISQKDHLSDSDADSENGLRNRSLNEYQSFFEKGEPYLL